MKKIVYRVSVIFITIFFLSVLYLSTIGIKTDKFNDRIISQLKNIDSNFDIIINDISAKLNIFTFSLNIKTYGTNLIYKNKIIKLENIKSKISLRSIIDNRIVLSKISRFQQKLYWQKI